MADHGPDQILVERVQSGDKEAFNLLVLKYQHKLLKLISRYIRDSSEVLDVAQESFLKAYRALPNFRGDSAFYTWLYRIAINTAKNHLVSQSRRPPDSDVDLPELLTVNDALDRLARLDERQARVVELRFFGGLTTAEIAESLGVSERTIQGDWAHGRAWLKRELSRESAG